MERILSLKWLLEPLKFVLVILSMLAIICTIIKASSLKWDFSPTGFHTFVILYSDYAVLFTATFILINVQLIIKQQTITENENKKRWQAEERNASLVQCQYYFNDIQLQLKEFIKNRVCSGMIIEWPGLKEVNREGLKKAYPHFYEKFAKMDKDEFHQSVILLYKIDAFASMFNHGITDIDVGKKIIGHVYCRQIDFLMGLIAYLNTQNDLFQNTLQLYYTWNSEN
jgi:hypothetical protein